MPSSVRQSSRLGASGMEHILDRTLLGAATLDWPDVESTGHIARRVLPLQCLVKDDQVPIPTDTSADVVKVDRDSSSKSQGHTPRLFPTGAP